MKQFTFVVDVDRCIGCKGCQVACKMENCVALGEGRNKVCTIGPNGVYPDLELYFLPTMCQQCENPSCVQACPTGACYKREEDEVILVDQDRCVGCGSCRRACPYQMIRSSRELRTADKCTLCAQLRAVGDTPACVRNCSGGALHYGDINDPSSEVSKLLAETEPQCIYTLRDLGNRPTVRYILRRDHWVDVLPQDCVEHSAHRRGGKQA
ncbi:4Fe-4S dicluster domain-containing protein [Flavonifractor plautii]|uniref:4Fe-4S dicluster domain-containing protein n=1 Tax=Flavonifractor plautii TaxID=292800 RepID=UPI001956FCD0|nr:4Fe-4S dicluster domain-containing protein [Flavonifractor plautii]MBM6663515.1 4Fe-4S dicluster domain-containing protein [Flavonifractor plautii]